jgi:hypothetical protein
MISLGKGLDFVSADGGRRRGRGIPVSYGAGGGCRSIRCNGRWLWRPPVLIQSWELIVSIRAYRSAAPRRVCPWLFLGSPAGASIGHLLVQAPDLRSRVDKGGGSASAYGLRSAPLVQCPIPPNPQALVAYPQLLGHLLQGPPAGK